LNGNTSYIPQNVSQKQQLDSANTQYNVLQAEHIRDKKQLKRQ